METGEPSSIWEQVAASGLAVALRENAWAYPLLETLHILGLALAVGGIIVFDVRLLGYARSIAVVDLSRHVLRFVLAGITINVATGLALFISDAAEFAGNRSLHVKLVLIALAFVNAGLYQSGPGRDVGTWDRGDAPPLRVRLHAAASIALWLGVMTAGRMMAYLK